MSNEDHKIEPEAGPGLRRPDDDRGYRPLARFLGVALISSAVHLAFVASGVFENLSAKIEAQPQTRRIRPMRVVERTDPTTAPEPEESEQEPEVVEEIPKEILRRPPKVKEPEPETTGDEGEGDPGDGELGDGGGRGPMFAGGPFLPGTGRGPGGSGPYVPLGSGRRGRGRGGSGKRSGDGDRASSSKKKRGKAKRKIDATKPIDRPERASAPIPSPGNVRPSYPEALRKDGVSGLVVVKLHVHRDGVVRGAKIIRVTNTAGTTEERARANKLLKAAVVRAIKTWRYTPSKYEGEPISVWTIVNFPFKVVVG